MAAVAAEPGAAAASTTAGDGVEFEPEPVEPEAKLEADSTQDYATEMDLCHQLKDVDAVQECSQVQMEMVRRPDLQAAGKTLVAHAEDEHIETDCLGSRDDKTEEHVLMDYKLKDIVAKGERLKEPFSPTVEAANEVTPRESHACLLPSSISDSQPSVVFLHSLPAHPMETETVLSLAEPAEPAIEYYQNPESTHPADIECDFIGLMKPSCETDREPEPAYNVHESNFQSPEDALHELPQPTDHPESLSILEETPLGESLEKGYISDFSSVSTKNSPKLNMAVDQALISPEPGDALAPQQRFDTDLLETQSELKPPVPCTEPCTEPTEERPETVDHLIPGSEVRVSLDHIIDDALVVSFRLGEKLFSGVLMDLSKRFGPYGIPITVFPKREYKDKPESMQLRTEPFQPETERGGAPEAPDAAPMEPSQVAAAPQTSPEPQPHPWTSKPPPLFQEGAPYPPPLFIRDTYNQSLPQPLPRKIRRPKRRLYREEPTSIMNAIKLRPRQVLCDKCKGAVVGDKRETRRGPASDCRAEDAKRRRNDSAAAAAGKRPRNEERGRATEGPKRQASGIRVSSSSSSSLGQVKGGAAGNRVVKGVSNAPAPPPNSSSRVQLSAKKVLQSKNVDHSKAREVLKMAKAAQRRQREAIPGSPGNTKAMTRAAALQEAHQKVHFTRRLQQLSGGGPGAAPPLPPRMRIKPQRYRNEENDSSPCKLPCLEKVAGGGRLAPLPKPAGSRCTSTRSSSSSSSSSCSAGQAAATEAQGPAQALEPQLSPLGQAQPPPQPQPHTAQEHRDPEVEPEEQEGREEGREEVWEEVREEVREEAREEVREEAREEVQEERRETRGSKAGNLVVYMTLNPSQPDSSNTSLCSVDSADDLKSSNSECSSTETFDFPPPGDLRSAPAPGTSSAVVVAAASPPPPPKDEKKLSKSHKAAVFSKNVSKCVALDGRTICVGDIVWAKIYGFPWWPARILAIAVSRKDNGLLVRQEARVSWFGSPTTSFLGLSQLAPFLESFQSRFDKKRKGLYRKAITEAANAAKQLTPEVRALLTQFET